GPAGDRIGERRRLPTGGSAIHRAELAASRVRPPPSWRSCLRQEQRSGWLWVCQLRSLVASWMAGGAASCWATTRLRVPRIRSRDSTVKLSQSWGGLRGRGALIGGGGGTVVVGDLRMMTLLVDSS